ncbi:hypothetical protein [Actinophytocola xanthii]|uniref:Uncharacterized protein n=1 Tax=Actinophytocola xanthii TaxID=1912961 RepID=A0A1Q8CV17_9PSEU|nr:hypothetical protein [Actinophytocola xanthii]OLF18202.1 hypothetical protein BU204_07640 [Actinophytocola xanthii]
MDFFAEVVRTGTVLGLDEGLDPDVIRRAAGPPLVAEPWGDDLIWDYGSVRFHWVVREAPLPVQGFWFAVPVAELAPGLPFEDLRAATGMRFAESRDGYLAPESEMAVDVDPSTGAVTSIRSAFQRQWHLILRYADVETPTPDLRESWFAANEPAGAERAEWWLHVCYMISAQTWSIDDLEERMRWLSYARWAWDLAVARGHVSPATAVMNVAEDYAEAENRDLSLGPSSHDALVAECLSHVTGSMSRADKNLIDMAALHRHGISDPAVQAEFDKWYAVRTDVPRVRLPAQ